MNHTEQPNDSNLENQLSDMPLTQHLIELRRHFIRMFVVVLVIFLALVGFAREIYDIFSTPLVALLPSNSNIIATDITSSFLAPIKLTLYVSIFLAMPYILYQIWSFVAPGLYKHEKKIALPLLLSSVVLFYMGLAFAYYVVLNSVLSFFIQFSPDNVLPMTDIDSYLNFVLKLFLVFGATFEIPVLTLLLVLVGIVSVQSLADKRRYIIVACFGVSAIVTPPDGLSMILLAIPMWLLFEFGLILAKVLVKQKNSNVGNENNR
ncbi:Sec-independent protein translocase TatC [Moraxella macacae 0408225]|uniref:Sec-independent protein translocase protein TatC n=1 Tax=Moraxella macacae 0408225 TaxID=1230338 RepID=L2F7A3_9GAMM|nr:twin-arginine translocase subunit TatC [Moraxella macacae]ELA08959.1 Sec-independent protein translocase TatC [Moraxella macacae 0408225]